MRRLLCFAAYRIVIAWPFDSLKSRIYWALLPYAGEWAHYWSESAEYRPSR